MHKTVRAHVHALSWILLPVFLAVGIVFPVAGLAAVVCMTLPAVVAISRGRVWCGHYCPRGSFLDLVFRKVKGKLPHLTGPAMKIVRYGVFVLLMALFSVQLIFADNLYSAGLVFLRMVFATTLAALLLGILFGRRSWCGVCPMGTLSSLLSRLRLKRKKHAEMVIDGSLCVSCKACDRACPMKIEIHSFKETGSVAHSDCTSCRQCAKACPKKAIA